MAAKDSVVHFFEGIQGVLGYLGSGWYPGGARDGMAPFRSVGSDSGAIVTPGSSLQLAAVWACVRLISETIGTLPFELKQPDAKGRLQKAVTSPTYRMLRYAPNANMTAAEFWEMMAASVCLWGNAYAVKGKIANRVVSLDPLRPEFVTVFRNLAGEIRYAYLRGTERTEYAAADIMHIKGFGVDGLVGLSPIAMARQSIGRSIATDQASGKIFQSGLSAGGFIKYKTSFKTKEERDAVRSSIEAFTGSSNAGKTMVLENDMDYLPITINPVDAQMLESRLFNAEECCRWYGVPPPLIGQMSKSSSWASSLETLILLWLKTGLRAYLVKFEQAVSRSLSIPVGSVLKFDLDELERGDSAARAALWAASAQNGIKTRNEIRNDEGDAAIDGGDELTVQSNLVPLSKLGELGSKPTAPAPGDPVP
jgi:HK97 family phage portal protein